MAAPFRKRLFFADQRPDATSRTRLFAQLMHCPVLVGQAFGGLHMPNHVMDDFHEIDRRSRQLDAMSDKVVCDDLVPEIAWIAAALGRHIEHLPATLPRVGYPLLERLGVGDFSGDANSRAEILVTSVGEFLLVVGRAGRDGRLVGTPTFRKLGAAELLVHLGFDVRPFTEACRSAADLGLAIHLARHPAPEA